MKYKHIGMTRFSVQQTTTAVALIIAVASLAGLDLDEGQVTEVVVAVAVIVNALIAFIDRYKKGDITLWGTRK